MEATEVTETQKHMVGRFDRQRRAVMRVSFDGQLAHTISYPNAFAAAARVITTRDETKDTTIHGMGIVGR